MEMKENGNQMKEVCICIPTKDRPEMVKEVLEYTFPYYTNYEFKVMYVDSSDNTETREIVEAYQAKGYHNLLWKSINPDFCLDRKTFEILHGDADIYQAEYVWMINDSIAILPEALEIIAGIIPEHYDMIRLPASGDGKKEDYICTDINDWFQVCSKSMAHMASTIMNISLLRADPDWEQLYTKYVVTDSVGDGKHEYFFTIGLYLEQIAKLEHFRGIMLGKRVQWRRDSPCKKGRSYWNKIIFEVWARSYCDTILKLPEVYTDKIQVIRRSDNIVYGRFERQMMMEYRRQGLLDERVAWEYRNYWNMVSTLSEDEIMKIATLSMEELEAQPGNRHFDLSAWEKNLEWLERQVCGRQIIVFGAGVYGAYVLKKLVQDGYGPWIAGVAVTDPSVNLDVLEGYPVRCIRNYSDMRDQAQILIATLPDTGVKIEESLKDMGFRNCHLIFEIIEGNE